MVTPQSQTTGLLHLRMMNVFFNLLPRGIITAIEVPLKGANIWQLTTHSR